MTYTYLLDLKKEADVPQRGIISRTLYDDEKIKVVLFAFDAAQELSEHTSTLPAIIEVLEGNADITLGSEQKEAKPGTWIYMPPHLPHRILAKSELRILLTLIKSHLEGET